MDGLTQSQRQYLRRLAHDLKPLTQIGKNGLTDQVIAAVNNDLTAHELIKVKFLEHRDERKELAAELAQASRSDLVAMIGNTVILYRANYDDQRIVLPIRDGRGREV